jgi:hypothetical protein
MDFYLAKQYTYSTCSSYTFLTPDTSLPSVSPSQTRPSRFQVDGSRSRQKHIPLTCRLPVHRLSLLLSTDLLYLAVLAARFKVVTSSTSNPRRPLTSSHSSLQSNKASDTDVPRPLHPTKPAAIDQTHGRPEHRPSTTAAPAREIANKLQIKRPLLSLPHQPSGRRTVLRSSPKLTARPTVPPRRTRGCSRCKAQLHSLLAATLLAGYSTTDARRFRNAATATSPLPLLLPESTPLHPPSTTAALMPSLGFLKKKRTKDSQGSNDLNSPSSPTLERQTTAGGAGTPITPVTSNVSTKSDHMNHSNQPNQPFVGQNPNANTQNVPSIRNLINGPNYGDTNTGSQHDSAYASGTSSASTQHNVTPQLNIPGQKGTANPTRETKGKYTLSDFTLQRTLGTGSFGRVHLVQSKHNQRFYAVKVLKKQQVVKMKQVEHTNDERRMLQRCKHPFLITLWGTFQDSKNLYMVMDFIEGGELFSLLRKSQVSH